MRRLVQALQTLLAFALLALLIVGAWVIARYFWRAFQGLRPEVAAAIIAGAATVLVSVASVLISRMFERRQAIEMELRAQKIPTYEEFVGLWFRVLHHEKLGEDPPTSEELQRFFRDFTQKLLLWGSNGVVKEWSSWRRLYSSGAAPNNIDAMFAFEKLLKEIRRDTGHSNRGLNKGDLLGLFINDIGDYLRDGSDKTKRR